jgi:hypothetical protein
MAGLHESAALTTGIYVWYKAVHQHAHGVIMRNFYVEDDMGSIFPWIVDTHLPGHRKDHSMNFKHCENLKCYNYKKLCSCQIHSKKVCAETCIDQHILKIWRHEEAAHNISRVRIWESTNCHLSLFVQADSVMSHKQAVVLERACLPDQLLG